MGISTSTELAIRLKQALDQSKASKTALAAACGVTTQAVSSWLRTGRVHKRHLQTIAVQLNTSVAWLLGEQDGGVAERELVRLFAGLSEESRHKLVQEARWLANNEASHAGKAAGVKRIK
jgi:transcriptional regulator with XRE-family HTH domain